MAKTYVKKEVARRSVPNYRIMSDVVEEELEWLWFPYIPCGFITNMVGIGSAGKSTITSFIAAQLTKNRPFMHGQKTPGEGSVVLIEDEQGAEIGVKAKLRAHNADQSRIIYMDNVTNYEGQVEHFDLTKDVCTLEQLYVKYRDMRLIIVDPISAYMGNVNCNDNAAVRQGLMPIQKFIRDRNIAMIAINHFSKNSERTMENKSLGSVAFYNVARSEVLIHREIDRNDDETGNVFFGLNKHNFKTGLNPPTLMYQMIDDQVVFSEKTDWPNMKRIVEGKGKRGPKQANKTKDYEQWLDNATSGDGVTGTEAKRMADEMKVSRTRMYDIAKGLGVETNGRKTCGVWKKK